MTRIGQPGKIVQIPDPVEVPDYVPAPELEPQSEPAPAEPQRSEPVSDPV